MTFTRKSLANVFSAAVICSGITSLTYGQLDTDFSPRAFEGSPSTVRIESSEEGKVGLFRIYSFDEKGHITKVEQGSNRLGTTMTVDYLTDDSGRVLSSSANFMGNPTIKTIYTYDEKGRPTGHKISQLSSGKATGSLLIEYDENGHAVRETATHPPRLGEVLIRTFDSNDRPATEIVQSGERTIRTTTLTYNEKGCLVRRVIVLPSDREDWTVWVYEEEACRAVTKDHTNAIGNRAVTSYTYDDHGNVLSESKVRPGNKTQSTIALNWTYTYPQKKKDEPKAEEKKVG